AKGVWYTVWLHQVARQASPHVCVREGWGEAIATRPLGTSRAGRGDRRGRAGDDGRRRGRRVRRTRAGFGRWRPPQRRGGGAVLRRLDRELGRTVVGQLDARHPDAAAGIPREPVG